MILECKLNDNIINLLKEDLIWNQNIFAILENSKDFRVFVDDEVFPTGVVVNDGYYNYIYTKNDHFIEDVIEYLRYRKGAYGFSGVNIDLAKKIKSEFEIEWESPCTLYYYPNKTIDIDKIKIDICSVRLEDAYIIDKYYTYRDDDSIDEIKESIKNRLSRCVYKDGELASWLLMHKDNSLGPMFTKKEYRKEGYAIDVTLSLINELLKNKKIPFLHVVKGNFASDRLAKKCGFIELGDCDWFGIIVKE